MISGDSPLPIPLSPGQFDKLMGIADFWPARVQSGKEMIAGILPRWLMICTTPRHFKLLRRQSDGTYFATDRHADVLETLIDYLSVMTHNASSSGFSGGVIGWKSYDFHAGRTHPKPGPDFPVAFFGGYDCYFSRDEQSICLHVPDPHIGAQILQHPGLQEDPAPFLLTEAFHAHSSFEDYRRAFESIQQYLHAGDCYQVNLAQQFTAPCAGSSYEAFNHLMRRTEPPHAAYFGTSFGDIISLSPELFFRFEDRQVISCPIKGTRPRGRSHHEDEALHRDLSTHPKDRAENLMIVDLLRNDMGKLAETGSVTVEALFEIHTFPNIHHMISRISARLAPGVHPLRLLFDAFPGGSITGAPKVRAMEIIAELEDFKRSIYCGSIGWMTPDGRGEWNIAIRTLLRVDDTAYAWAGGGIVADSVCEDEYQECFNKIGPLLASLEGRFLHP